MNEHIRQILGDRVNGPMTTALVRIWRVTIVAILGVAAMGAATVLLLLR